MSGEDVLCPSFTFVATSNSIEMFVDISDDANPAQIKLLVEMLEIISFNNSLLYDKVMATLADIDHPLRKTILSMMPKKYIKEAPAVGALDAWRNG